MENGNRWDKISKEDVIISLIYFFVFLVGMGVHWIYTLFPAVEGTITLINILIAAGASISILGFCGFVLLLITNKFVFDPIKDEASSVTYTEEELDDTMDSDSIEINVPYGDIYDDLQELGYINMPEEEEEEEEEEEM